MSFDRWMDKEDVEYYSALKENEIMPLAATGMDIQIIILSEVNQTEKNKYHLLFIREI